jgi:hypothetical protein
VVRRRVSILLLLAFAGVASGALQNLHQRQHDQAAAAWALALEAVTGKHGPHPATPPTSTANCIICLALNLPLLAHSAAVSVAGLIFLALATILRPTMSLIQPLVLSIDCRGPPAH